MVAAHEFHGPARQVDQTRVRDPDERCPGLGGRSPAENLASRPTGRAPPERGGLPARSPDSWGPGDPCTREVGRPSRDWRSSRGERAAHDGPTPPPRAPRSEGGTVRLVHSVHRRAGDPSDLRDESGDQGETARRIPAASERRRPGHGLGHLVAVKRTLGEHGHAGAEAGPGAERSRPDEAGRLRTRGLRSGDGDPELGRLR